MNRYFSLFQKENTADIYIYGDITSWAWYEDEVSSYTLSKQLKELTDVDEINIYINSYGGEVAEGLAIYNCLKRHNAKINTYVDGFACSIASVIFMAGDNRYMSNTSLLMIHNAWTYTMGNADELRKQAEDLDTITQASINAYMDHVNISEEELSNLLDNETWLDSSSALEKGFASELITVEDKQVASQSVRMAINQKLLQDINKPEPKNDISKEEINSMIKTEITKILEQKEEPEEPKEESPKENKIKNMLMALTKGDN